MKRVNLKKRTQGSPEELAHLWIRNNNWYSKWSLSIAAGGCPILKKWASAVTGHTNIVLVGSHGYYNK